MPVVDQPIKVYLWDASALVKLFVDEGVGSENAHKLRVPLKCFNYTTKYTPTEALGALKGKWNRHEISDEKYINSIIHLHSTLMTFKFCESLDNRNNLIEAVRIVKQYNIDIIDASAIVGITKGVLGSFRHDSGPFLLTADNGMEKAAKDLGIKTINVLNSTVPQ